MPSADVAKVARDRLEAAGYRDAFVKRFDSFTGREAICVRQMQPTVTERYMDGTQEMEQPYEVIVRRRSAADARETCCAIAELLEDASLPSENGSYRFTSGRVYLEPQELELDESGFFAWSVVMAATIETN